MDKNFIFIGDKEYEIEKVDENEFRCRITLSEDHSKTFIAESIKELQERVTNHFRK